MNSQKDNETELIARLNEGDRQAFSAFYQEFYKELAYFAFKIIQDMPQAEDLATEAFVKLWNYRSKIESKAHLKSYLFLAVRHSVIDFLRIKKIRTQVFETIFAHAPDQTTLLELALVEAEIIQEVTRQVDELPKQCAAIVRHILLDGMTTGEIAGIMNISPKTVLNQKLLSVQKIRMALLKKGLLGVVWIFFEKFS